MSADELADYHLRQRLEWLLGPDPTITLMSRLPPTTWGTFATAKDVHHEVDGLRAEMHTEFAAVRVEMQMEFAAVRSDMDAGLAAVRSDMDAGFAAVRSETHEGFRAVQRELLGVRGDLSLALERHTRWMVTFMTTLAAIAVTVSQLL